MKLLLEISDQDIGQGGPPRYDKPYRFRRAARAVICDSRGRISVQSVVKHDFHKLPGGGLEGDETVFEALKREAREEAGTEIKIGEPLGIVIEYRDRYDLIQISYCYLAELVGEAGEPQYEDDELAASFEPLWMSIDEAIAKIGSDQPKDYEGNFIIKRDLAILNEAKKILNQ